MVAEDDDSFSLFLQSGMHVRGGAVLDMIGCQTGLIPGPATPRRVSIHPRWWRFCGADGRGGARRARCASSETAIPNGLIEMFVRGDPVAEREILMDSPRKH